MPIVLQINSVVNSGSTGRITEEIGQEAIKKGYESYIAYARNDTFSSSHLIKIGGNLDVVLHGLKTRLFDLHGFGSKKATKILIKKIELLSPDIIHLHNIHGYYLNFDLLFKYLSNAKIPIVWTLHDCWPITGHCVHFELIGCNKWKIECQNCPQKNNYPASYVFDRSKQNFLQKKIIFNSVKKMYIITVSNWLSNILEHSYLSNFPRKIISNGVNLEVFKIKNNTHEIKAKYKIGNRFMLLGVATSWTKKKGLSDYLELSKFLPNDCVIVLVGLSSSQIKSLPKSIIGLSRTEEITELSNLYSAADIVLNLSYEESFGLTTIEGLACGTPGIVYNCTASPELITPSTGLIVNKNNIKELLKSIEIIKYRGKKSYTNACRDRAEKFYNKNVQFKEYIELYNSLINKD